MSNRPEEENKQQEEERNNAPEEDVRMEGAGAQETVNFEELEALAQRLSQNKEQMLQQQREQLQNCSHYPKDLIFATLLKILKK